MVADLEKQPSKSLLLLWSIFSLNYHRGVIKFFGEKHVRHIG